jgi:hypothetical protein
MGSKARYEIIRGKLDDLTELTAIERSVTPNIGSERGTAEGAVSELPPASTGGRNDTLFDMLCKEARRLPSKIDTFIARARELNQTFAVPMSDPEVVKTAKSVFRYVETGQLRTGERGAWFKTDQVNQLVQDPYLFTLIAWLKAKNGPDAEFWIANGLAEKHLNWSEKQLRPVRRRAIEGGWVEMIVPPGKGRNAVYRWGPTARNLGVPKTSPYPQ